MVNTAYKKKALETLESNILKFGSQRFITAGRNQFRTLWVRDFCYSVPGLLSAGYTDVVKNQLQLISGYRHQNGFLPRGLDVMAPQLRVVLNLIKKDLSFYQYPDSFEKFQMRLKPEYFGEHKTVAFDSNVLFCLAAFQYMEKTHDFFVSEQEFIHLLKVYLSFKNDELFCQPAYSDWQDSASRAEPMLLFHLQLLSVLKRLKRQLNLVLADFSIDALEAVILKKYYYPKNHFFYQDLAHRRISLENYGFIFTESLFTGSLNHRELYFALKESSLWNQNFIPGRPVFPAYTKEEVSWTTRLVGLGGYHHQFHWGWLIAEAYKISCLLKDTEEAKKIKEFYFNQIKTDPFLAEIYLCKEEKLEMYSEFLYQSEAPFTWTAAKWLEAFSYEK